MRGVPKTVGRLRICAREGNSRRGTQDRRCLGSDAGTETLGRLNVPRFLVLSRNERTI